MVGPVSLRTLNMAYSRLANPTPADLAEVIKRLRQTGRRPYEATVEVEPSLRIRWISSLGQVPTKGDMEQVRILGKVRASIEAQLTAYYQDGTG